MKILFLDIDGVLCLLQDEGSEKLDPTACEHLKRIIEKTGCKLVLTSTWRLYPKYVRLLLDQLAPYGITKADFLGKTDLLNTRAEEILDFYKRHGKIERFVILDDKKIRSKRIPADCLIQTNGRTGITEAIAEKCIALLSTE